MNKLNKKRCDLIWSHLEVMVESDVKTQSIIVVPFKDNDSLEISNVTVPTCQRFLFMRVKESTVWGLNVSLAYIEQSKPIEIAHEIYTRILNEFKQK